MEKENKKQKSYETFIQEFKRIQFNPIYFLEEYYNKVSPDKILLSDEEKQKLYDQFKGVPYFENFSDMSSYSERIKELKEQGYKDWEIH